MPDTEAAIGATIEPVSHCARILIVDDDARNRALMEIALDGEGFELASASGGVEALSMVAQRAPHLILLDVSMPGMDGYQVAARLKADPATRSVPIIMVTALDDRDARLRGLEVGAEDFLSKPIDRKELKVRVRNLARLKTADDDRYGLALANEVSSRTADLLERTQTLEQQATDLYARTALLEQMRVDQLKFKNDFLSHVSHELRSPLTAIKQFTSILESGLAGALTQEQGEYLRIVLRNVDQLQSMIDDLLEVTRLETGKLTILPERVSLAEAIADAVDTLRENARLKDIEVTIVATDNLPPAHADPTRLRQIIINLLENAIKFTPPGGQVSVTAQVRATMPPMLQCDVSDSGCGVGADAAPHIFERLYQADNGAASSRKGLGLGLHICNELVQRQQGTIRARDHAPLAGTTFSFTLPVFTLDDVIAPLFQQGRWPAESLALFVVETSMPVVTASREDRDSWSRHARQLLQRCLLPDLDVLLPHVSAGDNALRFFVAVFADASGIAILANRVRGQFEQLAREQHPGLSVHTCTRPVVLPTAADGPAPEQLINALAARLHGAITAYDSTDPHFVTHHQP
jgi:signal transduction histidine kinase